MNTFRQLLLTLWLLTTATGAAAAQSLTAPLAIPAAQQRSPATFDDYPYRPACRQLTAAPGGAPGWFAWGPTVEGRHQNWRGIEATVPPEEPINGWLRWVSASVDGELVPLSTASSLVSRSTPIRGPTQRRTA